MGYRYAANSLSLGIAQTTNSFLDLTIYTATTSASYDVFGTTNLSDTATNLNRTNWVWLARITGGTTNFSWGLTNWCERYFQLGTLVDDDLDGLTTAYEILVSHTRWAAGDGWDSDGDGLSDDFELRYSTPTPTIPTPATPARPTATKTRTATVRHIWMRCGMARRHWLSTRRRLRRMWPCILFSAAPTRPSLGNLRAAP